MKFALSSASHTERSETSAMSLAYRQGLAAHRAFLEHNNTPEPTESRGRFARVAASL